MIKTKFAQLHTALFLAGTNFGLNIDAEKGRFKGLNMVWDRENKELHVFHKDDVAVIPSSNVASVIPFNKLDLGSLAPKAEITVVEVKAPPVTKKLKAQVSTPTDHVFAGEKR